MKIRFIYSKKIYEIENKKELMIHSIIKFSSSIRISLNKLYFMVNGKKIDIKKNIKPKSKCLTIFVFNFEKIKHEKDFNNFTCPQCNNPAFINIINNDTIIVNNCKFKHNTLDLTFNEYIQNTFYDEEKCAICKNYENLYGQKFSICSCEKKICPLCFAHHDSTHKAVEYDKRLFKCIEHGKPFLTYCSTCNKNLCQDCEKDHTKHKTFFNKKIMPKANDIVKIVTIAEEVRNVTKLLKNELKRLNYIFTGSIKSILNDIEGYSKINDKIFTTISKMENYETIKNILYLYEFNRNQKKYLRDFLNDTFSNKIKRILDEYEKKKNELTILYTKDRDNLKLFSKYFVNKNKNNCYLKIKGKKQELNEFYYCLEDDENLKQIKIKLIKEKKLEYMDNMFSDCKSLLSFGENNLFENNDTKYIYKMFYGCDSLVSVPGISIWNISNIKDISEIFYGCKSLKSLPDISIWNTSNVEKMDSIFYGCKSLKILPDISNWDTSNVIYMSELFYGCESLLEIPDISVWNTLKVKIMDEMFYNCKSLNKLPDISVWNTSNVIDMIDIFYGCNVSNPPEIKVSSTFKSEEIFLESIDYKHFLECNKENENNNENKFEKFCEGFFITSLSENVLNIMDDNSNLPSPCNHEKCSKQTSYKPEILFIYPLNEIHDINFEDLAEICYPNGIKICIDKTIEQNTNINFYICSIKNKKNEKFYLMVYNFYLKMTKYKLSKKYLKKEDLDELINNSIQIKDDYEQFNYVPACICLISKYLYSRQIQKCLKSIFTIINKYDDINNSSLINNLVMFLVNSIPIPQLNSNINFIIPFCNEFIDLDCPKIDGVDLINTNISFILKYIGLDNILIIFRLLLMEKKILLIDYDYERLSAISDGFISILYPFKWVHLYIPILSKQKIKMLESNEPYIIGINSCLLNLVKDTLTNIHLEDNQEIFLVYISENRIELSSSLLGKKKNVDKYIQDNIPILPDDNLKWDLIKILKYEYKTKIKYYTQESKNLSYKIRDSFIDFFVELLGNYRKYVESEDGKIVFDISLFLKIMETKDKNKKVVKFYEEFVSKDLFSHFADNIENQDMLKYFNERLELKKNKKKIDIYDKDELLKLHKQYYVIPKFLSIQKKNKNLKEIEKEMKEIYPEEKKDIKITENDIRIDKDKFNENLCQIFVLPEEENERKKSFIVI